MARKRIGEILIEAGVLTPEQLHEGLKKQKETGEPLGRVLAKLGFLTEHDFIIALSQQLDLPYLFLDNYNFDPEVKNLIPEEYARHNKIIPLFRIDSTLMIGISDPSNIDIFDELSRMTKMEIEPTLCAESEILESLDEIYGASKDMESVMQKIRTMDRGSTQRPDQESPMIQLVELMFQQAVKMKASDIHVEPEENLLRVRYRIDGVMQTVYEHPAELQDEIISRIKVMSSLNITEKRVPQDGRFNMTIGEKRFDFRVSTLPTVYGENVVIRILDQSAIQMKLEDLGMAPETFKSFNRVLHEPNGIILVTGPTGSGKSTTLYAALNSINTPDKNIITVEDPVEYRLPLIRQSNVNHKIGLTFAAGLRSILRQDPDIIMVGEIRDSETATVAVQAAMTGHLVLSTLHTNDTVSSATRLIEMGVEPFLVAASTKAILAQRLVRRICDRCKETYDPEPEIIEELNLTKVAGKIKFSRGKGCKHCRNTGYKGRLGLYEILEITESLRRLIVANAGYDDLLDQALDEGLIQLKYDGIRKVIQGQTTLEEVLRVSN
ncbi:MAG: type II secretion system protein GspE [Candidatus Neomarinimicrobiota bacterium]|nr:MAG: type II secretion system protein GspE [Candidatus Neomarinimicrobiota bacterium]